MCESKIPKRGLRKPFFLFVFYLGLTFTAPGCGSDADLPIIKIKNSLEEIPTYSIVLENMKEEGNFVNSYYHKYRIVRPEGAETTDWLQVPESYYQRNEDFLGMTIFAKKEGIPDEDVTPPGYLYVGDPRYGQWQNDGHGGSYWAFYGKYRLMTDLFGGWYRPVYDLDFDAYKKFKQRKVPYYGLKNQYGTSGTIVRETKPDFYSRYAARQKVKTASFTDKVSNRIGRTRTSLRSRSGGRGK